MKVTRASKSPPVPAGGPPGVPQAATEADAPRGPHDKSFEWFGGSLASPLFGGENPDGPVELARRATAIAAVLETLPPRQKWVLVLRYLECLQLTEIAEVLGLTLEDILQLHSSAVLNLARVKSASSRPPATCANLRGPDCAGVSAGESLARQRRVGSAAPGSHSLLGVGLC